MMFKDFLEEFRSLGNHTICQVSLSGVAAIETSLIYVYVCVYELLLPFLPPSLPPRFMLEGELKYSGVDPARTQHCHRLIVRCGGAQREACQYHTGELLPVGVINDVIGNDLYSGFTELISYVIDIPSQHICGVKIG